jgi:hypothetical protein
MAKAKQNQQTGKTVLEKRRLKKAKQAARAEERRRAESVRPVA